MIEVLDKKWCKQNIASQINFNSRVLFMIHTIWASNISENPMFIHKIYSMIIFDLKNVLPLWFLMSWNVVNVSNWNDVFFRNIFVCLSRLMIMQVYDAQIYIKPNVPCFCQSVVKWLYATLNNFVLHFHGFTYWIVIEVTLILHHV